MIAEMGVPSQAEQLVKRLSGEYQQREGVCVCEREREIEGGRERERERGREGEREIVCVRACERERESVCVCARVRDTRANCSSRTNRARHQRRCALLFSFRFTLQLRFE